VITSFRFALHGPMFSGKSTLAKLLEMEHGFENLDYTDWGKSLVAQALQGMLARRVTHDEVRVRKNEPRMREFTIAALRFYGFDEGVGVKEMASTLEPEQPAVFDNVRYLPQYHALIPYGFTLVRLVINPYEQVLRADRAGMPYEKLVQLRRETSEQPLPEQAGEVRLVVDGRTPRDLVEMLLATMRVRQLPLESEAAG